MVGGITVGKMNDIINGASTTSYCGRYKKYRWIKWMDEILKNQSNRQNP